MFPPKAWAKWKAFLHYDVAHFLLANELISQLFYSFLDRRILILWRNLVTSTVDTTGFEYTRREGPVENAIVDLPINSKRISAGNSLRPLGTQNKDIGAVSQIEGALRWPRQPKRHF